MRTCLRLKQSMSLGKTKMQHDDMQNIFLREIEEDWIVSYADIVTLLLCFFILFFSETVKNSSDQVIEAIAKVFTTETAAGATQDKVQGAHQVSQKQSQMLSSIESGFENKMKGLDAQTLQYGVERKRKELLIRLWEQDFYQRGSWVLTEKGATVLAEIANVIKPFENKVRIIMEAHTDSSPVTPNSRYSSNLELSAKRAIEAAKIMIAQGYSESHVFVSGLGASKPLHNDLNPDGSWNAEAAAKNRRIEIRLTPLDE